MNPPAFQFYPDDFLGGTMNFTDAELGLYVRLLCVQWSQGGLPDDDAELLSYSKGRTSITRLKSKFKKGQDGLLRNDRLEQERCKQAAYRESRAANGKHGGRPCKAHENHMVLKTKAQESSPSPSPFVSPLDNTYVLSPAEAGSDGPKESSKPTAKRNENMDALATIAGIPIAEIGQAVAKRLNSCLTTIKQSTPNLTAAEINRRSANYRAHFRDANLTPEALAKHWGTCADEPQIRSSKGRASFA